MQQELTAAGTENTMSLKKLCGHLKTITKHKLLVMDLCFRCGMPAQGLLHDLSKYSITELRTGARYYLGTRSPNAEEKDEKGYSEAWLHHKGRNKHHFEYWIDPSGAQPYVKMPLKYALEMVCDRISACKAYHGKNYQDGDALAYYQSRRHRSDAYMHPETAMLLEELLTRLRDEGEEKTTAYMRWLLKHPEHYENISQTSVPGPFQE